ncbi:MAG: efflux RND transporter periplasmic adaptor subunit [Halioglobus sp.]|jgi:HlyD family secretion protein
MDNSGEPAQGDIREILDQDHTNGRRTVWKRGLLILLALAACWALWRFVDAGGNGEVAFRTAEVQRADLTITVTATGELMPVNQVEVGTEVSGTIETVEADYNDTVTAGQVLARLDPEQLEARLRQAKAALALASARVQDADATIMETRNRLRRTRELLNKGLSSQENLDIAEAAFRRAEASRAIAAAQVIQAEAVLDAEQTALSKAVIRSPIDGIVLKRSIEPGQTVAASFQAPVLFTLAEDLTKMELHVDIDEADVGQVRVGQSASFTVDAYPDRRFPGKILKVYNAPQVVQDVVTYEAILAVDNSALLLRPGMTATADIIVKRVEDALLVPNAALRFTPPAQGDSRGSNRPLLPGPPLPEKDLSRAIVPGQAQQRVWTLEAGRPAMVPLTIGVTDGRMTEVVEGGLVAGMPLLVDVVRAAR